MKHILLMLFTALVILPARADKIAIAVVDLDAKGEGLDPGVGQAFTEKIRFEVAKNKNFDLVAREKMVELTREKALQLTGITNDSTAVQIGKALNVKAMVFGSVSRLGQEFTLYIRAVDVETEKVECSETESAGESAGRLGNYAPDPVRRLLACMLIQVRRQAVEKAPQDAEAHYLLATALGGAGKYGEAERECREAVRLKPTHEEAHFYLGATLNAQGRYSEAEREYRETVRINPDHAKAHAGLAGALSLENRFEDAEREARIAIRLNFDMPDAHSYLGMALMKKKRYAEAETEFREVNRLKPDDVSAVLAIAAILDEQGKRRDARAWWTQALKLEKRPEWIQSIKDRLAKPD